MIKTAVKQITIASLLISFSTFNANAGYVIKNDKSFITNQASEGAKNTTKKIISDLKQYPTSNQIGEENQKTRNKKRSTSGWEGTASMYCAIFGLLIFPPGLIAAIILGALGLGEGKKHRGRAIAGLIIGITSVFLIATLLVLFSA